MVEFNCDNCGAPRHTPISQYRRKKRHFCDRKCYAEYRRDVLPIDEQNAWQGGVTPEESRRRWNQKNKQVLNARAKARKLRELNAPGSHTRKEWEYIRDVKYGGQCAEHDGSCKGSITKDHEVPLIMGGSQNPDNLQPLCRSHNSRKSTRVHLEFKEKTDEKDA